MGKSGCTKNTPRAAGRGKTEATHSLPLPKKRLEPFKFGTALHKVPCIYLPESGNVPTFVAEAAEVIRQNVLCEGLFRKSGDLRRQSILRKQVERGEPLRGLDVHDVTSLVKTFFRMLPVPLVPQLFHDPLLNSLQLPEDKRAEAVQGLCFSLPAPHLSCLRFLMLLMDYIRRHATVNKMTASNLAVVLTPSLIRLQTGSKLMNQEELRVLPMQTALVEYLIDHADSIGAMTYEMHKHSVLLAESVLRNNLNKRKGKKDKGDQSPEDRVRLAHAVLGLVADLHFRPNTANTVSDSQLVNASCSSVMCFGNDANKKWRRSNCRCNKHRKKEKESSRRYIADTLSIYSLPWSVLADYCTVHYHRGPSPAVAPTAFSISKRFHIGCERLSPKELIESWSRAIPLILTIRQFQDKSAFSGSSLETLPSCEDSVLDTDVPSGEWSSSHGKRRRAKPRRFHGDVGNHASRGFGDFRESSRTSGLAGYMKREWFSTQSLDQTSDSYSSCTEAERAIRQRQQRHSSKKRRKGSPSSVADKNTTNYQAEQEEGRVDELGDSVCCRQPQEQVDTAHNLSYERRLDVSADSLTGSECPSIISADEHFRDTIQCGNVEERPGNSAESRESLDIVNEVKMLPEGQTENVNLDGNEHVQGVLDSLHAQNDCERISSDSRYDTLFAGGEQECNEDMVLSAAEDSYVVVNGDSDNSVGQDTDFHAGCEEAGTGIPVLASDAESCDDPVFTAQMVHSRRPSSESGDSEVSANSCPQHSQQSPNPASDSALYHVWDHHDRHKIPPENVHMLLHSEDVFPVSVPQEFLSPRRMIREQMKTRMRESRQSAKLPSHLGRDKRGPTQSSRRNTISEFSAFAPHAFSDGVLSCGCPDCVYSTGLSHFSDHEIDNRRQEEATSHTEEDIRSDIPDDSAVYGHSEVAPQHTPQYIHEPRHPAHHHQRSNLVLNRRRRMTCAADGWFQTQPGGQDQHRDMIRVGYYGRGHFDREGSWHGHDGSHWQAGEEGYPEEIMYHNYPFSYSGSSDGVSGQIQRAAMHDGFDNQEVAYEMPPRLESYYTSRLSPKPQIEHHMMATRTSSTPRHQYGTDVQGHHTAWAPHQASSQTFLADRIRSAHAHRVLSGHDGGLCRPPPVSKRRRMMMIQQSEPVRDLPSDPHRSFAHHLQHRHDVDRELLGFSHCEGDGLPAEDKRFELVQDEQVMPSGQPEGHRETKPGADSTETDFPAEFRHSESVPSLQNDYLDPRWRNWDFQGRHLEESFVFDGRRVLGAFEDAVTSLQRQLELMNLGASYPHSETMTDHLGHSDQETPHGVISRASARGREQGKPDTWENFPPNYFSRPGSDGLHCTRNVTFLSGTYTPNEREEDASSHQQMLDPYADGANETSGSVSLCSERLTQQNYNPNRAVSADSDSTFTRHENDTSSASSSTASLSLSYRENYKPGRMMSSDSVSVFSGYRSRSASQASNRESTSNNALTVSSDDEDSALHSSSISSSRVLASSSFEVTGSVEDQLEVCEEGTILAGQSQEDVLNTDDPKSVEFPSLVNVTPKKAYFEPDGDITFK